MRINEQEYQRILATIDRLTAIDELAAYRSHLRTLYRGDGRLAWVEKAIDLRAQDLTSTEP